MEERAAAKEKGMRERAGLPVYFPRVACELSGQLHPPVVKLTHIRIIFYWYLDGGGTVRT